MLRTTQNKIYRQGIANATELEDGFPAKVEELFAYQGLIIGGIEAGYFTPAQLDLIRQFADRRGGGVLFLGGRFGLADGGWARIARGRNAARHSARPQGHLSPRPGQRRADGRRA